MYHRVYAKIDLNALEFNIDSIRQKLQGKAKLLGVIKADAYGHGAVEIAKMYQDKFDFFGVACIEEALELKLKAKSKIPILVLGYVSPMCFKEVVKYDIRIPIFDIDSAKALSKEAVRQNKTVPFHFAADTGMSRIGFQVTENDADICKEIAALPNIKAEGLFSHFATADETDLTKAKAQRERYIKFSDMLTARGIDIPIKHLNNSAGIMEFDKLFNMCRAGIILYGLYPSHEVDTTLLDIHPVMSLISHISHIKTLDVGREISYGGTYKTKEPRRIATIPVGYADGYPRCLSNIGKVIINGKYAPITGRVCMDQFMVDVTDIPDAKVEDEVILIGKSGDCSLTMEDVSEAAYSFNYELPCRIARRVPRVFVKDDKEVIAVNYITNSIDY